VKDAERPPAETLTEINEPETVPVVVGPNFFSPYAYFSASFRISAFRQVQSLFFVIFVPSIFLKGSGNFVPPVAPVRLTVQLEPSNSDGALKPRHARTSSILEVKWWSPHITDECDFVALPRDGPGKMTSFLRSDIKTSCIREKVHETMDLSSEV
jgi:hypothetical protein